MTKQPSDRVMITLSLISFFATLLVIAYMVISGDFKSENCWDKYPNNEVEAILNCEGKE